MSTVNWFLHYCHSVSLKRNASLHSESANNLISLDMYSLTNEHTFRTHKDLTFMNVVKIGTNKYYLIGPIIADVFFLELNEKSGFWEISLLFLWGILWWIHSFALLWVWINSDMSFITYRVQIKHWSSGLNSVISGLVHLSLSLAGPLVQLYVSKIKYN